MSTLRRLSAGVLLALAISACSPPTLDFSIGECLNLPDGDLITGYESVDCDEAHDAEVYALPQHPDGPDAVYPGASSLGEFAEERCTGAFPEYVGVAYEESEIYFSPLTPSQDSWDQAGDREVVCLLRGVPLEDGGSGFTQLTGSKAGTGE